MKILAWLGISLLVYGGVVFGYSLQEPIKPAVSKPSQRVFDIKVYDLWQETNKLRSEPLELDAELNRTAKKKCEYMRKKNLWGHEGFEKFVHPLGRGYYGENLAYGQVSSKQVTKGWKASPGHYRNIKDPGFENVGFGVCKFRGFRLVVQHFSN